MRLMPHGTGTKNSVREHNANVTRTLPMGRMESTARSDAVDKDSGVVQKPARGSLDSHDFEEVLCQS